MFMYFFFFFFFFQAEDGIRDKLVTGVQTCALPIYAFSGISTGFDQIVPGGDAGEGVQGPVARVEGDGPAGDAGPEGRHLRSEERRVGKECRSRWSPGR